MDLAQTRVFFRSDRFATECAGAEILEIGERYAKCALTVAPQHCNAIGRPMGGVVFTLADFCFAVAANHETHSTVSQAAQVTFLGAAKGRTLIAEARCIRSGRTTCLYQVEIADELGTQVAFVTVNGYHTNNG